MNERSDLSSHTPKIDRKFVNQRGLEAHQHSLWLLAIKSTLCCLATCQNKSASDFEKFNLRNRNKLDGVEDEHGSNEAVVWSW